VNFVNIFSSRTHSDLPLFDDVLGVQVRNAELAWREAKRQLRKDHRWELAELLDREEKEKLFNQHIEQLAKKKKEKFR
jgi:transcription elongation regulator 1